MQYRDNNGDLHLTEAEARRANKYNKSGVDQAAETVGGAGFAIIIWVFLGFALLIFLLNNIKYFIIAAVLVAGFKVVRKVTKDRPWFVRVSSTVGVIVLGIIAVLWCFFDMATKVIPPITNTATIKESTPIIKLGFPMSYSEIGVVEKGDAIQVLGSTNTGRFKIKTSDGITGYVESNAVLEKDEITAYMPPFLSRVNEMYLKSTPYVNLPGKYKTAGDDFVLELIKGNQLRDSGIESKIVKNKEPIIINGVPYNYTRTIQINKSWATPYKGEPEDSWQNESRRKYMPIYEQYVGDYVIISQTSFVDPKGRTWKLEEKKK